MSTTAAVGISRKEVQVIDKAISPVLRRWNLSHSTDIRGLIRDCYFQGLMDGSSEAVRKALEDAK